MNNREGEMDEDDGAVLSFNSSSLFYVPFLLIKSTSHKN